MNNSSASASLTKVGRYDQLGRAVRAHPVRIGTGSAFFLFDVTRDGDERFWIHREGFPHTEAMHLIERITRTDMNSLRYEITIDDPAAYTEPWSAMWIKNWSPGQEIIEYFCHENNIDQFHMVGQ